MPYVPPARAASLDDGAVMLRGADLAYVLSADIARFFEERSLDYAAISDVRGAVAAALNEFERRVAEVYEDGKLFLGEDPYVFLKDSALITHKLEQRKYIEQHDRRRKGLE